MAQSILLCLDVVDGAGLDSGLQVGQLCLSLALDVGGHLVAVLLQHLLSLEDHLVGAVADVHFLALLLIVGSKLLSFLHSLVDVVLGHVGGSGDGDVLLLAGTQVLRADLHDAVCINIEGDFDLRHTTGSRSDAIQMEDAEALVVAGELTLALQDIDLNRGLVIRSSGEDLALVGRNGGVALNDLGADAAQSLNAEAQRGDIQQQQTLDVALQDAALDSSTDSHALIGVDALEGLAVQLFLDCIVDSGDTGGTTDHQDLLQIRCAQAGILQSLADRGHGAVNQICGQLVELCTGQGHIQMLGAGSVSSDEGQVDLAAHSAGQLDLCLLGSFLQALSGHLILAQVDAVLSLEGVSHPVDDALVEIVAAQMGVAVGGQNFGDAVAHLNDGDIEGAAAQVVDHDLLVIFLIDAVCQRSGGRLVDDTLDVQAGDGAGVLGSLTLAVVEVSRNGDDGLGDRLAQISLRISLQLLQDHSADLLRSVLLAVQGHLVVGTHLTLDGRNGVLGVGDGLTLCDLTDQTVTGLGEANNRRGGAGALGVCNDDGLAALHDSHAAIRSTKVNTNDFAHK